MKITFIADNYPPERNAAAARVHERALYWARWGHQVRVITSAPNFPEGRLFPGYTNRWFSRESWEGIEVIRVKTFMAPNAGTWLRTLDFLSFMVMACWATIWTSLGCRPDVVVATSPQFFAGVAGWLASAMLRVPFVLEVSDLWPASIVAVGAMRRGLAIRLLEVAELFLYQKATRIAVQTHAFFRDLLGRGVPPRKMDVVLNGVELGQYSPRPKDAAKAAEFGIGSDEFVIGYLGTLGMAHGLDNVLAAAALLAGEPVRLLLVGPGAERVFLQEEIKRRGLRNVRLADPQPKEQMPQAWSVCDVALVHLKNAAVFSSVIPSKIFEAMAMGLPILLVAPDGEASALIQREQCGIHVPAGCPEALAGAIVSLMKDNGTRARLAIAAERAAPAYSREKQAHQMLAVLTAAVNEPIQPQAVNRLREWEIGGAGGNRTRE